MKVCTEPQKLDRKKGNFIFLAGGLFWLYRAFRRRLAGLEVTLLWCWLSVTGASVVQALMDYGENPRYGVPFQALIVWVVLAGGWCMWKKRGLRAAVEGDET